MSVYIAPEVADVIALHPYLGTPQFRTQALGAQLTWQAQTIFEAHRSGDTRVRMHVMSWWPKARGLTLDQIMQIPFSLADARSTIAREYGFADWTRIPDITPPKAFEEALDAMLSGDLNLLQDRIHNHSDLVTQRAVYGHGATLLHYLGANGVESHRQVTPLNAPQMARLLINSGADPQGTAQMYGGDQMPIDLASTSAHPQGAGIAVALNAVLTP